MKRIHILFIVLLCCSIGVLRGQDVLSISQCYDLARANYPLIHQHRLIEQTEQYRLSNIGKSWLPQVAIHAKASYQSDVTELPFNGKQLSSLMPGTDIPTLSKDQYQVIAQVGQTIWDGGNARSSRALTRAEATANRKALDSELYALNQRVNELYFGCLLQKELIHQNALLQKDFQTNINRILSMMKNGMANQSDLESMQVELLNAQQRAIELKAGKKAFLQMLATFIGKPIPENCQLEVPELPQTASVSLINRPELRTFEAKDALLVSRNRLLTAGLMPRFSAFVQGGFGRPALNMLSNDFEPFYIAGVRLTWNLGKLYTLKNDRRTIEINRHSLNVERETFLFNTRLQLLQQDTEIQKMNDLMQADKEIIRLRENIKKAAEVKLSNGVIAVTDLIREINAEDQARQTASTHQIQHLKNSYDRIHTTNQQY